MARQRRMRPLLSFIGHGIDVREQAQWFSSPFPGKRAMRFPLFSAERTILDSIPSPSRTEAKYCAPKSSLPGGFVVSVWIYSTRIFVRLFFYRTPIHCIKLFLKGCGAGSRIVGRIRHEVSTKIILCSPTLYC